MNSFNINDILSQMKIDVKPIEPTKKTNPVESVEYYLFETEETTFHLESRTKFKTDNEQSQINRAFNAIERRIKEDSISDRFSYIPDQEIKRTPKTSLEKTIDSFNIYLSNM